MEYAQERQECTMEDGMDNAPCLQLLECCVSRCWDLWGHDALVPLGRCTSSFAAG